MTGLYTIELATGTARLVGPLGDGMTDVIDVAFVAKFAAGGSQFTPVAPTRLLDTRNGTKPAANSTTDLQVTGMAGAHQHDGDRGEHDGDKGDRCRLHHGVPNQRCDPSPRTST